MSRVPRLGETATPQIPAFRSFLPSMNRCHFVGLVKYKAIHLIHLQIYLLQSFTRSNF